MVQATPQKSQALQRSHQKLITQLGSGDDFPAGET